MTINIRDSGVWKEAKPYVRDAGSWKEVLVGYVRDGGVWKEFYNSGALRDRWTKVASLPAVYSRGFAVTLNSGEVLVTGGTAPASYLYDEGFDSWGSGLKHPNGDRSVGVTLPNGKVLSTVRNSTTMYLYNPSTGLWSTTTSLPVKSGGGPAAMALMSNNKILLIPSSSPITPYIYDPVLDSWSTAALPGESLYGSSGMAIATVGNLTYLFFCGAYPSNNRTYSYNPTLDSWVRKSDAPTIESTSRGVSLGDNQNIFIKYGTIDKTYMYDTVNDTWSNKANLPYYSGGYEGMALLPSGKVLVTGGNSDTSDAYIYG